MNVFQRVSTISGLIGHSADSHGRCIQDFEFTVDTPIVEVLQTLYAPLTRLMFILAGVVTVQQPFINDGGWQNIFTTPTFRFLPFCADSNSLSSFKQLTPPTTTISWAVNPSLLSAHHKATISPVLFSKRGRYRDGHPNQTGTLLLPTTFTIVINSHQPTNLSNLYAASLATTAVSKNISNCRFLQPQLRLQIQIQHMHD